MITTHLFARTSALGAGSAENETLVFPADGVINWIDAEIYFAQTAVADTQVLITGGLGGVPTAGDQNDDRTVFNFVAGLSIQAATPNFVRRLGKFMGPNLQIPFSKNQTFVMRVVAGADIAPTVYWIMQVEWM